MCILLLFKEDIMCIMLPVGNSYNVLELFTKHLLQHNKKFHKVSLHGLRGVSGINNC